MTPLEIEERDGYTLEIHVDLDPESPREWSNLGQLVFTSRKYSHLSDKDTKSWHYITARDNGGVCIPIRSNSDYNTQFADSDDDDDNTDGYIYVTRDKILAEYGGKIITRKRREQTRKILLAELDTFNQYLAGEVYGYIIHDDDGNNIDSCWGYFGYDCAKSEAREALAGALAHRSVVGSYSI